MNQNLLKNFNKIWLSIVAVNLMLLAFLPDWFSRESISGFLEGLGALALATYIFVSLARALLFLPITPFIIAGAITFPDMPVILWVISTLGVVVGAFIVYSFPSLGGYDKFLGRTIQKPLIILSANYWVDTRFGLLPAGHFFQPFLRMLFVMFQE